MDIRPLQIRVKIPTLCMPVLCLSTPLADHYCIIVITNIVTIQCLCFVATIAMIAT